MPVGSAAFTNSDEKTSLDDDETMAAAAKDEGTEEKGAEATANEAAADEAAAAKDEAAPMEAADGEAPGAAVEGGYAPAEVQASGGDGPSPPNSARDRARGGGFRPSPRLKADDGASQRRNRNMSGMLMGTLQRELQRHFKGASTDFHMPKNAQAVHLRFRGDKVASTPRLPPCPFAPFVPCPYGPCARDLPPEYVAGHPAHTLLATMPIRCWPHC